MKSLFLARHISTKTGQDDALTFMGMTFRLAPHKKTVHLLVYMSNDIYSMHFSNSCIIVVMQIEKESEYSI